MSDLPAQKRPAQQPSRQSPATGRSDVRRPLSWPVRCLALASGLTTFVVLVLARSLEPSASGFGTHRQLGFPECTSVVLFGVKCPSCGMTTSWALATRGQCLEALHCNAGGFMLAVIAMAYLPASCYFLIGGHASRRGWFSLVLGISVLTALGVSIIQWWIRLSL